MKACEWIDRLKVKKGMPSDYAAAKFLGISQSSIIKMRTRNSTLDDESSLKVAMALEIDPILILADQATERSKDESVQTAWRGVLAQLLNGKEKAPHLAGLGLITGGNGGIRTLDEALHPILP